MFGPGHGGAAGDEDASAGPADELAYGRFVELDDAGDLPVGVVERLPQHVRGTFGGREPFQQQQHRELQGLGPLGAKAGIGAGVDGFGQPRAEAGLAADAGGLRGVDRQPGGRGGQERGGIVDRGTVVDLPAQPDVLHQVLSLGDAGQHPVGDPEQAWPHAGEHRRRLLQIGHRHRPLLLTSAIPRLLPPERRGQAGGQVQARKISSCHTSRRYPVLLP
ncbi:hypothetical protein HD596_008973 [Nonomuraea jabiensis]|uniref:Uncharacterized protein n=1 Tax=Nonomuraea jabiensis TaxID=882448 RepID=A0A7W9LFS8_9ACTN|nr:hypothetical protein [Nonomuraea jabiensis]